MKTKDLDVLQYCRYLWEEYRYRHDLIWQRVFRFTTAVVLLSVISDVQREIAISLGGWILLAPALATILFIVMTYLSSLAALSLANGWIAFTVWLPRLQEIPFC